MQPNNPITYFAETDARNKKVKFGIKAVDRLKHMYVIGKTGMGKSTLLENMAIQDIQNGEGLAFIDPHGSTAEKLLDYVPEHRIKDVLYFAPFDMENPIAFNVMEDVAPDKRHLVVNGLMATFEKIWADAWSARMAYILQYAIIALLEYPGSSLLSINKMLSDKEYRKKVVDNVTDASAKSFWVDEFGKYTERFAAEATPAIQNKVGQFTSNALVRNIVGQSKSSFDIRDMMDNKKILIINLSKGQVGELNARLLGSMMITKIYLAAMSRADKTKEELNKLPNFYLYVDEFQSFANKSFADILSEARKYKLNLTIAHQYVEQMEEEVRDAVFGNVGTMITFRVGAPDAELLEKEFAPVFTAEDLVNLGFTQIYLKLMIDGVSSSPFSATSLDTPPKPTVSFKAQVIESSKKTYGRIRRDVETEITKFYESGRMPTPPANPQKSFQAPFSPERELGSGRQNYDRNQLPRREEPKIEERKPFNRDVPLNTAKITNPDSVAKVEIDKNKQAFSVIAQELKERSLKQGVVQSGDDFNREKKIVPSVQGENTIDTNKRPQISLSDLKPDHEKAKIPTKENIGGLKDALSAVIGKSKIETQGQKVEITNTKKEIESKSDAVQQKVESTPSKNSDFKTPASAPREVSEDVLRKLLEVEKPKV